MRSEAWPELLFSWVDKVRDRPFEWGAWDCVIAVNDALVAMGCGKELDVSWSDMKSAARILKAEGGLEAAVTARLGQPIDRAYAQRGDVVLVHNADAEDPRKDVLAVCLGSVAAAPSSTGLAFVEMSKAIAVWKA